VDEVEVDVLGVEELEGGVDGLLDIVGMVLVIPQLGDQEDLLTRDARAFDALRAGSLSAVAAIDQRNEDKLFSSTGNIHMGSVDVTVASLQRLVDSICLRAGVLPGAEPEGWHGGAGVHLES